MKEFKNYIPPSWDELFMSKVYEIARKSKDPRTKIGAIIVRDNHAILEGYNGIVKGVKDLSDRMERPEKYNWMEHAERNAIYMAARYGILTDCTTLYTQGMPCTDCMRGVIQAGIVEIVLHKQWENVSSTIVNTGSWRDHYYKSEIMANEAGLCIRYFDKILNKTGYLDGKEFNV